MVLVLCITATAKPILAQSDPSLEDLEKKRAEIVEQINKVKKEREDQKRRDILAGGIPDKIYVYRVEVTNAPLPAKEQASNMVSGIVATFIQNIGLGNMCVDLRELGSATRWGEDHVLEHGTEGILLQTTIPEERIPELQNAICKGAANCQIGITSKEADISELKFVSYFVYPDGYNHSIYKVKSNSKLPAFSNACVTGKYADSWNDAASTPESRKYLADLGLDINQTRTLSLFGTIDNVPDKELWDFGFPRHSPNVEKPTK